MKNYLRYRIQNPTAPRLDSFVVPVDDELVRRFKELSEDLWAINGFNSPQFSQAEVVPLVASAAEIDDEGLFKTATTEAVTTDFEKLLGDIEFAMALSVGQASLLRAVMVRVKSKCKIDAHIDDTFMGIPHSVYRCQLAGDIQLRWRDGQGFDDRFFPEIKRAVFIPSGMIQEEENLGLNDSIHMLFYTQEKTGSDTSKALFEKRQLEQEKRLHNKIY